MKPFFKYSLIVSLLIQVISCNKTSFYLNAKQEVVLSGDRLKQQKITLSNDSIYLLAESINLITGQQLDIEGGALIKANTGVRITINPGAKITAAGTPSNPVVFTAAALKGTGGAISQVGISPNTQWDGIVINGSPSATSGSLNYVRIEFTGNGAGLTLVNVDSTTRLSNIQFSYCQPIACVFNGGNVNASNLLAYASYKTDFVFQNGYTGKIQNIVAYRSPFFPDINTLYNSNEAILLTGSSTFPTISNLTVLGPDTQPLRSDAPYYNETSAAILINSGAYFRLRNSVISGYPKNGIYMNNRNSGLALQNGPSELTYTLAHSNDTSRIFFVPTGLVPGVPTVDAAAFKRFMLEPRFSNEITISTTYFNYINPYDYQNKPNPYPGSGSPLLSGANFDGAFYSDPFFKKVNYRGAFGNDRWTDGWTEFNPLRANYNN